MKVFCYFVEPASYTLDLIENIYSKQNISYCFIYAKSFAQSNNSSSNDLYLSKYSLFSRVKYIFRVWKSHDFIIINGYNNYPFLLTFILNLFSSNRKYIAIDSDSQLNIPKNLLKRFVKNLYLTYIFSSKYVIGFAGGSNTHKELFKHYGMEDSRIFLIPMMVNNSKFMKLKKRFPAIFTFLYVGRLVEQKNVEGLIKEFNKQFMNKKVLLNIVGAGQQETYLTNKYSSNQVIFKGPKFDENLIYEYQNASCLVCPSLFEPWGLVVNEALSSGLPVIVRKEVGATYDLISGRETGLIAEDNLDLGRHMSSIYTDEHIQHQFSINAVKLMKDLWNYKYYSKCLSDVFKQIEKWD